MKNNNVDLHKTISLIYTTAADPEQWPELLNALAGFVDNIQQGTTDQPNSVLSVVLDEPDDNDSLTLASALGSLPSINEQNGTLADNMTDMSSILLAHFKSALKVSQRLLEYEDHNDMVTSLLDRLPVAILVVNEDCEVIELNSLARSLLENEKFITLENSKLTVDDSKICDMLHASVKALAHSAPTAIHDKALMLDHGDRAEDCSMAYLSAIKSDDASEHSHVAIFISRPKSQPFILPESFVSLYGLTNKESEVTAYLARGYSIKEIAEQKYVSEHTVRTHVKAVMSKTGLRRQSDLLRFVLMGPDENNLAIDGPGRQILKQNSETETSSRSIMLPDGRRLTFQEYGDPNGTPMIFFHSVRGSQLEVENLAAQAAYENGIRLIAPNRPGYGLSDPKHLDTVLDYINDVTVLTDSLGLKTFDVGGYVLGGLFAKAVTWAMPERVNRLLLISCGVTAKTDEDYKNMIPLYKMSNKLARELPKVIRMLSPILVRGMLRNPAKFLEQFATQLEPKEAALFESSSFSDRIIKALQDAAYQGSRHIGREVVLLNQPWGFDPAEIRVPVTLWYGDRDRHMPIILGEKLASKIPNCKLKVVEGAGHFMAYRHMNKIFADMVK